MKLVNLSTLYPSTLHRYRYEVFSQDTLVNSIGSVSVNQSYRDVNVPVHVPIQTHPAAILTLSPDALALLTNPVTK
ncbi:MAG: hypothetical protein EBU90_28010 [Proteobacteria bacterium]|nr:hypothetical protein [Pseudomonadota bacterium]